MLKQTISRALSKAKTEQLGILWLIGETGFVSTPLRIMLYNFKHNNLSQHVVSIHDDMQQSKYKTQIKQLTLQIQLPVHKIISCLK